jgi:hypothetical protein
MEDASHKQFGINFRVLNPLQISATIANRIKALLQRAEDSSRFVLAV